jgi:hypothetical protein
MLLYRLNIQKFSFPPEHADWLWGSPSLIFNWYWTLLEDKLDNLSLTSAGIKND